VSGRPTVLRDGAVVSSTEKDVEESFASALAREEAGAAFYKRAAAVTADPRVRLIFQRLERVQQDQVKLLRDRAVSMAVRGGRPGKPPAVFPTEAFARVECYVCGHSAADIPEACPECGSARYAFEKEISKAMAWELAATSARGSASYLRSLEERYPASRPLLDGLRAAEETSARDAEGELARSKS